MRLPDLEVPPLYTPYDVAATNLRKPRRLTLDDKEKLARLTARLKKDCHSEDKDDETENEHSNEDAFEHAYNIVDRINERAENNDLQYNLLGVAPNRRTVNTGRSSNQNKRKRSVSTSSLSSSKKSRLQKVYVVNREIPDKPPGDLKEYCVITLSNGLQAVLTRKPVFITNSQDGEFLRILTDCLEKQRYSQQHNFYSNFPHGFPLTSLPTAKCVIDILRSEARDNPQSVVPQRIDIENNHLNLYHNNHEDHSTATLAVVVNVGVTDDPADCLGLAHFTEHMVHYGSKKFPEEDFYVNFIFNEGYEFNAFTQNNTTTYYNAVPVKSLSKSMDMMSNMLATPVFKNSMTTREINAVDSEFHLKRHFDILRRWFLFQVAIKDNPLGKFGFGNAETLQNPENIHEAIRDFHSTYYVASAMTVSVESTMSLSSQEEMILAHFSDLPQGTRKMYRETYPTVKEKRVVGKDYNKDYVVQGLCSFSNFWVAWPVTKDSLKKIGNKSVDVLLKVLRDDGEGTLVDYLTKQNYIWLMFCGSPIDSMLMENKHTTFITIDFFLTPKGEDNIYDILKATYSVIHQLLKVPDSKFHAIFKEIKLKQAMNSEFGLNFTREHSTPISTANGLQRVRSKDILKDEQWSWQDASYKPGEIRSILQKMQVENMIAIQILPSSKGIRHFVKGEQTRIAPYTKAEYVVMEMTKRFKNVDKNLNKLKVPYTFRVMKDVPDLQSAALLPVHHGVIAKQDLTLPSLFGVKVMKAIHFGNSANNYRSVCLVNYTSLMVMTNARTLAMALLWTTTVYLSMPKEAYEETSLFTVPHMYGITLGVLLKRPEKFQSRVEAFNREFFVLPVLEANFKMAKAALITFYDVLLASNEEFITNDLIHFMTCDHSGDVLSDALRHIKSSTLQEVHNFSMAFRKDAMAILLVGGNVAVPTANDLITTINKQATEYTSYFNMVGLVWNYIFHNDPCSPYSTPIRTGDRCVRMKSDYCYSYTTTVKNFYYVGEFDRTKYYLWWNSLQFFKGRAFCYLRMMKQLGYAIGTYFPLPQENHPMVIGVSVTATASKFSPCELDKHIDEFMVYYGKYLTTVSEKMFHDMQIRKGDTHSTVKLADAREWYQKFFGPSFASDDKFKYQKIGMTKISLQILGNESKHCGCETCKEVSGWRRGDFWNHFRFATGEGSSKSYFVDDPKKIRDGK